MLYIENNSIDDTVFNAIQSGFVGFSLQEICDISNSNAILYHECLAKLKMPDGKVRVAGDFIPALEASGMIAAFDRHMLELAFDWLSENPVGSIGCNISPRSFWECETWSRLYEVIVRHYSLAPRMILEITESLPIGTIDETAARLESLRSLGCQIAIDDFGTGYSTVEALVSIPVDIVKIDAMFVKPRQPAMDERILECMVTLASCVAPTVVVEGIETLAELNAARSAGASHVQGYLFCNPTLKPAHWGLPRSYGHGTSIWTI